MAKWEPGQIVTVDKHIYQVRYKKCGYKSQKYPPCVLWHLAQNCKFTMEDCNKNIPQDCYLKEIKPKKLWSN